MNPQPIQRAVDVGLVLTWVALTLVCGIVILLLLLTGNGAGGHDIVSYWAAAKLLHNGANPYDYASVFALQRANGLPAGMDALMVRNPPPVLPLIAPLGWFGLRAASLVWSSWLLAAWAVSCLCLWARKNSYELVVLGFGPALFCIMSGQSALLCLLGVALFARFYRRWPFVAGACLSLCALKPHLFVPAAAVLVVWCVIERQWRLFAGLLTAMTVAVGVAFALDPHAWAQYRSMMAGEPLSREYIPCLGVELRYALHGGAWLQYAPCILATVAAVWFFFRHRSTWDWRTHGPLLLALSVVFAPYAWITDQVLLVPAVLQLVERRPAALRGAAAINAIMTVEFLGRVSLHSAAFLWSAPAWLLLCVWGGFSGGDFRRMTGAFRVQPAHEAAPTEAL